MASDSTILGMERKSFFFTVMAVFIILLFVGSSLVFLNGNYQNPDTQNQNPDTNAPAPTTFPFESKQNVSAKVSQVFPVILILAKTNNARIDELDAEIFQKGAVNISSQYVGQDNNLLMYRAEIQIPSTKSASDFLNVIRTDVNDLREVQAAVRGMVQLDSVNAITMYNADLNLEQTLIPTEPFVPCLLAETTQKGDVVQIMMRAQFAGSVSSNVESYEVSNSSTESTPQTVAGTASIEKITPTLYVSGKVPSSLFPTQAQFESYMSHIPDTNQVQATLFASKSIVTLAIDQLPTNHGFDRNTFLNHVADWNNADVNSYSTQPIDGNGLAILFTLNNAEKTGAFMKTLTEQLKSWNLPEDTPIQETYFPYQIQADLNTTQNKQAFSAINEWFTLRDLNATIQQPGYAFVSTLMVDANSSLDVNQSVLIALNHPHDINDSINVNWMYELVRGKLSNIQGKEK